jgi:Na+:H+ antiporter, NhaA family
LLKHKIRTSAFRVKSQVTGLVALLLKDEAISGKFLMAAAAIAVILVNSPLRDAYMSIWDQHISFGFGQWMLSETFRYWIENGLMALFFLVISLEIKREIVSGELRTFRVASLPIVAAIGGMVVPIAIYMYFNQGQAGFMGWGTPMTTDTAFAVGILALLGDRVPGRLKLFLLTVMVVDDVGAIGVIALFYTEHLSVMPLLWAAGILATIILLHWLRFLRLSTFVVLGILLWLAIHSSGVHASITGVILGLAAPIMTRRRTKGAIAERLEAGLIPVSTFVVIPLFALASAGVVFSATAFDTNAATMVGLGVGLGLIFGKLIGIVGATWLMVKLRCASLPDGVRWPHVIGAGFLGGVGFTLSIFIAELAFHADNESFVVAAKLSIFAASAVSAICGYLWLRYVAPSDHNARPEVVK